MSKVFKSLDIRLLDLLNGIQLLRGIRKTNRKSKRAGAGAHETMYVQANLYDYDMCMRISHQMQATVVILPKDPRAIDSLGRVYDRTRPRSAK